jgi:hypothetical protein
LGAAFDVGNGGSRHPLNQRVVQQRPTAAVQRLLEMLPQSRRSSDTRAFTAQLREIAFANNRKGHCKSVSAESQTLR